MLKRMKMDITECIKYYNNFMKVVFLEQGYWGKKGQAIKAAWGGEKWDAAPMEKVIKDLIREKIGDPDKRSMTPRSRTPVQDAGFLMAVNKDGANNHAPVTLPRRRTAGQQPSRLVLWNETLAVFGPTRPVNFFLSIGTGTAKSEALPDATASNFIGLATGIASIAINTEMVNILFRSLINAFSPKPTEKKYWRFKIGDGCPDYVLQEDGTYKWVYLEKREEMSLGELDDVAAMDNTIKATQAYIKLEGASLMIKECAVSLAAVV
ncbi:patatin-like phospholipase [Lasiosphaeria hispida]|uniref:Patatin-like phospholipase n=1 Tax=Lasiosphaeria hispida TaxID=260671 RepID=A0AAJ0HK47_9PEZI|nr:patatin-like phospholipase [Lasiosphaeria hispida]